MPIPALILVLCFPGRRQTTRPRISVGLRRRPSRMATATVSPIASSRRVGKNTPPCSSSGRKRARNAAPVGKCALRMVMWGTEGHRITKKRSFVKCIAETRCVETADFDYLLPPECIAATPAPKRDDARLLVLDRGRAACKHARFSDLLGYLPPRSVLVLNDTRVFPARLRGR